MTSNGFASRDDFFGATKRRFKTVPMPGGKTCRIRSLTAGEWATIDSANVNKKRGGLDHAGLRLSDLRLFVACVCDENGEQLFKDSDIPQLESLDNALVTPVVREIREHCGLRQDVEDVIKNCETTDSSASPSSSAAQSPTT
jgi:hypothetical protein